MANSLFVHIMLKEGSDVSSKTLVHLDFVGAGSIQSTWACFDHITLIRTWNRAPFFCWIPYSSGNIVSKFENFSQPVRQNFFEVVDRFVEATGKRHCYGSFDALFLASLSPGAPNRFGE